MERSIANRHIQQLLNTIVWSTRPDRDGTFGCARKCSAWIWRVCRNTGTDTWAPCRTRGADAATCSSSRWSRGYSVGSSDSCSGNTLCSVSWRRSGGHLKNSKSRVSGGDNARFALRISVLARDHEYTRIRVVELVERSKINIRTNARFSWIDVSCEDSHGADVSVARNRKRSMPIRDWKEDYVCYV